MAIKFINKYFLTISLLALSANAISRDISYDYVQGTYASITDSKALVWTWMQLDFL